MEEVSEENIIKWSEGNKLLEKAIRSAYKNGFKTFSACGGHIEKNKRPSLTYIIDLENVEQIDKMINIYSKIYKYKGIACSVGIKKDEDNEKFLMIGFDSDFDDADKMFNILDIEVSKKNDEINLNEKVKDIVDVFKYLLKKCADYRITIRTEKNPENEDVLFKIFLHEKSKDVENMLISLGFEKNGEFEIKEYGIYQAKFHIEGNKLLEKLKRENS